MIADASRELPDRQFARIPDCLTTTVRLSDCPSAPPPGRVFEIKDDVSLALRSETLLNAAPLSSTSIDEVLLAAVNLHPEAWDLPTYHL